MTYDDLKLDDGQILDVLDIARTHGALAMIHAENADCIEWLTKRLEAAGRTAPRWHAHARPMLVEREATHRAIALSELVDVPILIVHVSGREAIEQIRWARTRAVRVCRDLPAVSVPHRGRPGHRRQLPGRALRLQPAAARQGQPGNHLGRPGRRTVHRVLVRPRALRFDDPQGKKPGGQRCPSATSPTASRGWRRDCRCCTRKACWAAASRCRSSSSSPRPIPPRPMACIRARAPSRWAAMPTWWCGTSAR